MPAELFDPPGLRPVIVVLNRMPQERFRERHSVG
jgi:hypothetical protein